MIKCSLCTFKQFLNGRRKWQILVIFSHIDSSEMKNNTRIWFSIFLTVRPSSIEAKNIILHSKNQNQVCEGTGNLKNASVKADLGQTLYISNFDIVYKIVY